MSERPAHRVQAAGRRSAVPQYLHRDGTVSPQPEPAPAAPEPPVAPAPAALED